MNTFEFVSELRGRDIRLWAEGGELCFSAPLNSLTPDVRAELARRKGDILLFLKEAEGTRASDAPPIQPIPRDGDLPLSFGQQRLWFLNQLQGGHPAYNYPTALRLLGGLDPKALERSLTEIVNRHESLRTTFPSTDGRPRQVIAPSQPSPFRVVDLQSVPHSEREARALDLAREEARHAFDLDRGPLFRTTLFQLGDSDHILLLLTHHIVSDGWSDGVLYREMAALYAAFVEGKPSPLPPLPIQYADFAVWQRRWLQGEVLDTQLSYWKRQLAGALPILELPSDRPRPAVQSFRGAKHPVVIGRSLTEAARALSHREGVTLFMTLLSVFQTLLFRYTGQGDLSVGSGIANRNRPEIEGLIGFFVNTLVLRTDLSDDPSFRELLGRVRQVALEAYAHQDLPFEKLVEELKPERDLSYNPLFQVNFGLQSDRTPETQVAGLTLRRREIDTGTAMFDMHFFLEETRDGLVGWIEYATDLFDDSTIARMVGHYRTLLEEAVADPESRLSAIPMLRPEERQRLLIDWNPIAALGDEPECLHRLFEARVERSPEAIAVVFEDERVSYAELNRRANRLARYLQKRGVGPEVMVGLYVERSLEMVVGVLGILKAGGAYVPMDPSYPPERLAFMVGDAQMPLVVTEERLAGAVTGSGARLVRLDADKEQIGRESGENLPEAAAPESLAYVIYTSGSTGVPKGVLVTHQNVSRLFDATDAWFGFEEGDVWTLFHSLAFDFSVWEIWGALLYGGRLVIVSHAVSRSPEAFAELLSKEGVTVLNQTPSAFRQLARAEADSGALRDSKLRLVIFGGEALEIPSLKPWFERHGEDRPRLVNMYGITETTVHVTYRPLTIEDGSASGSLIGRPIPDLQVYILDTHLQPVPIGVRGDIYVGGAGVARGYWNRPELTHERFLPNPHGEEGARLYMTGDLGRYRSNGDIEYLGRADQQVKIRGFRIELGEIESVLGQAPGVAQTAVVIRKDRRGEPRLTAYVVPAELEPRQVEITAFLKRKLPDYMLPALLFLEGLPRTPSGKLDRQALPDPAELPTRRDSERVAPAAGMEERIAGTWREVLRIEKVGAEENFFDLGGHSIALVEVHSKLRALGHEDLPITALFQYPTVRALARFLEGSGESRGSRGRILERVEKQKRSLARQRERLEAVKPHG